MNWLLRFSGHLLLITGWVLWVSPVKSSSSGNAETGKLVYQQCQACHSLKRNRTGPRHCGLIGRKAGTAAAYDYSKAMQNSDIVWNRETLDAFLQSPFDTIPGNVMGYGGVWDDQARADLISYLIAVNQSEICNAAQSRSSEK